HWFLLVVSAMCDTSRKKDHQETRTIIIPETPFPPASRRKQSRWVSELPQKHDAPIAGRSDRSGFDNLVKTVYDSFAKFSVKV
ncbi:MAG: hypothetical protein D6759_16975, partial [Chloroflexi bacterium]